MTRKDTNGVHHCSTLDGDSTLYLTKRNGVYYYQRRIPKTSQPFFKRKQFKKSLKTRDKREAIVLARQFATEHDILFKEHETLAAQSKATEHPANRSHQIDFAEKQAQLLKLKELATFGSQQWIANQALQSNPLDGADSRITDVDAAIALFEPHIDLSQRLIDGEVSDYELYQTREWKVFEGHLPESQYKFYESFDSKTKRSAYLEFVTGLRSLMPSLLKKLSNPLADAEVPELPVDNFETSATPEHPVAPTKSVMQGELLSDCVAAYMDDKKANAIKEGTLQAYHARFDTMLRVLGDRPITDYNRDDARHLRETLLRLPANLNAQRYASMSIDEIVALGDKPRSKATVNDLMRTVSSLMKWCILEGKLTNNFFEGLQLRRDKKASEERSVFTPEDLNVWFSQDFYHHKAPLHSHYYWLPLLGLYTGARLNELCQLYVDDVKELEGVWYLNLTDERNDQRLKNSSSARTVPIHSKLIDLGFIEFVQSNEHQRLFPALKFDNKS